MAPSAQTITFIAFRIVFSIVLSLIRSGDMLPHVADQVPVLCHGGVAHRVRQIDGGGAGLDGALPHPVNKLPVAVVPLIFG